MYKEEKEYSEESRLMKKSIFKKTETSILADLMILLTAACIVVGILCIENVDDEWVRAHFFICAIAYSSLNTLLCGTGIVLLFTGKTGAAKTVLSVFILVLFATVVWLILQRTGFFDAFSDAESIRAYLERAGIWMPLLYVLLQFLQVVVLPIPSLVSTVAGIALFGAFWTMVYSFIGIMAGSVLAFVIGRKWGKRAVGWIIGNATLSKWQDKLKGKDNLVLTAMFILPLFPDDILCFVAGLSSMTTKYFLWMIAFSRILAIGCTCYSVRLIPFNTWWGLALWGIIACFFIFAFVLVYKNMDKLQSYIQKRHARTRKEKERK